MKTIRVGVIGVGIMGERHCRVYSNLRRTELVGLADSDSERGRFVAQNYETRYFEDFQQLLSEVDAVSIATSTPAHFELTMEALAHNVHVLVEKPLTATVEQGQKLVTEARQRQKILQVGHIERFNPAYIELKNVTTGLNIVAVNIKRLSPFDTSNIDVDVILDLMIHDLDLIISLLGNNLEGLNAWGRSTTTAAIDHAVANLSFRQGPIATLFASRITEQKVRTIEVIADGAYIEADLLGKSLLIHRRTFPHFESAKYRQESIIERIHVPMAEPLMLELDHFVDCVHNNSSPDVPGQDGVRALKLAQAVIDQIQHLQLLSTVEPF